MNDLRTRNTSLAGKEMPGPRADAGERRLSEELAALLAAFPERSVSFREIVTVLQARAYTLLLIFMALPFCTPIPLPGLSTPFGLVISLIGFRLLLMKKPWLPRRLLDTQAPSELLARLLKAARRLIQVMEYFLRPRLTFLLDVRPLHSMYGGIIAICGLLLLLPLPIPFSNLFPALTVVLIAAAILERDGGFLIAGVLTFALTLVFFGALAWGGAEVIQWIEETFGHVFAPDYEVE